MVTVVNIDKEQLLVSSANGAVYTIKGDAFLTKDMVLSWRGIPNKIEELEIHHFTAAFLIYPNISLIVLGAGNDIARPRKGF